MIFDTFLALGFLVFLFSVYSIVVDAIYIEKLDILRAKIKTFIMKRLGRTCGNCKYCKKTDKDDRCLNSYYRKTFRNIKTEKIPTKYFNFCSDILGTIDCRWIKK